MDSARSSLTSVDALDSPGDVQCRLISTPCWRPVLSQGSVHVRLFGIQFGAGLIIASLLFGVQHALNTYRPALGLSSLSWGWALSTFVGGLMLGAIREKTGTLLAPGIAHGLPDAVGEALAKVLSLM
jgi:membrane protease YdiL (CAAX protease family)